MMVTNALNCWEYMKCGRQPEGKKAAEKGICPAAKDTSFNGINRGKNAGNSKVKGLGINFKTADFEDS